jgi:activator of 2-hydroxyglutaryl-CoA dehydratase
MNIYKKIAQMLKSANNYEAEDLIINSFIKIAQIPENVRIDQNVLEYVQNLENQVYALQAKAFNFYQENQQLKSMMLESQGSPLLDKFKALPGTNPNNTILDVGGQDVTLVNPNNASPNTITITDKGTNFNSSENIQ